MKNAALQVIKSVGGNGEKVNVADIAKRNLQAQEARKALIAASGYPADYLDIPYTCKKAKRWK